MGDRERWANLTSGGNYFPVRDLAQLLPGVDHSEQDISKEMRDLMYGNFFGISDGQPPPQSPNGVNGYYSKAGALDGTVAQRTAIFAAYGIAWK